MSDDILFVNGNFNSFRVTATAKIVENSFIGFVDSLSVYDEPDNQHLQITGWSLDTHGYRPPLQILFCAYDKVISLHRVLTPRLDVVEAMEKNVATRCGFTFQVEKKHFENIDKCKIIFLSSSNFVHVAELKVGSIHS
jgi:hypothetical protein